MLFPYYLLVELFSLCVATSNTQLQPYQFPIFDFEKNEPFLQNTINITCGTSQCKCLRASKSVLFRCVGSVKDDDLITAVNIISNNSIGINVLWIEMDDKNDFPDPLPQIKILLGIKIKVPRLKLSKDNVKFLTTDTFESMSEVEVLDLSHNHISSLESAVFESLYLLVALNLAHNKIATFDLNVLVKNNELVTFDISSNTLETVSFDQTQGNDNIQSVSLANTTLNNEKLEGVILSPHTTRIYLDHNSISIIPVKFFMRTKMLKDLRLAENPLLCDCRNGQLFSWMKGIVDQTPDRKQAAASSSANKSILTMDTETEGSDIITSLKSTQCQSPKGNNTKAGYITKALTDITAQEMSGWCRARCPFKRPCFCTDVSSSLSVKCSSNIYEHVLKAGLSGYNLTRLDLTDILFEYNRLPNPFLPKVRITMLMITKCFIKELPEYIFGGISSGVNGISLQENGIHALNDRAFFNMTNLGRVSLSNNDIVRVPPTIFSKINVPNLYILDLSYNSIIDLRSTDFSPSLRDLYLQFNKIRYLRASTFKKLVNLEVLTLAGNALACNCDIFTFSVFINEFIQRYKSDNYRGNLTCNDVKLMTCQPPDSPENKTLFVLGLVSSPTYMVQCYNDSSIIINTGNTSSAHQVSAGFQAIDPGPEKGAKVKRWWPVITSVAILFLVIVIGLTIMIVFFKRKKGEGNERRSVAKFSSARSPKSETVDSRLYNEGEIGPKKISEISKSYASSVKSSDPQGYNNLSTNNLVGTPNTKTAGLEVGIKYGESEKVYFDYTPYIDDPDIYLNNYNKCS